MISEKTAPGLMFTKKAKYLIAVEGGIRLCRKNYPTWHTIACVRVCLLLMKIWLTHFEV